MVSASSGSPPGPVGLAEGGGSGGMSGDEGTRRQGQGIGQGSAMRCPATTTPAWHTAVRHPKHAQARVDGSGQRRTVSEYIIWDAVGVQVRVQARGGHVQAAQDAAGENVHHLDAIPCT